MGLNVYCPNTASCGVKFGILHSFCHAEFSGYYYLPSNPKYKENDYQPEELDDEVIADTSNNHYIYPKQTKLLSNEKLKRHKIPYVIQYYISDKKTSLEEYVNHMFLMGYPLRDETELFSGSPPTYDAKPSERGVTEVINQCYSLVEPFAAIADDAFERISSDIDKNMDPYVQQEYDEVNKDCIE